MFSVTNYSRNKSQNHNEMLLHEQLGWSLPKTKAGHSGLFISIAVSDARLFIVVTKHLMEHFKRRIDLFLLTISETYVHCCASR